MLPEIENLLHLQEADKEIRRLQEEIAELPKRVAAIEQKLAGTKAQLEKAQTAVKADEAARRKYDTAINDLRGKISKYRDQSLEVKTNEQYKALMHEIQFAEKDIAANEDKILESDGERGCARQRSEGRAGGTERGNCRDRKGKRAGAPTHGGRRETAYGVARQA